MRTVVIALGNKLMSDEGVAPAILEKLAAHPALPPGVTLADVGTSGFAVVHELPGHERAVIVDCALMGAPAGTILRFTPDEVRSRKILARGSTHEGDLMQTLELSRGLGECPDDVVLFGVQPVSLDPGDALSPELAARLDDYVDAVLDAVTAAPRAVEALSQTAN